MRYRQPGRQKDWFRLPPLSAEAAGHRAEALRRTHWEVEFEEVAPVPRRAPVEHPTAQFRPDPPITRTGFYPDGEAPKSELYAVARAVLQERA